MTEGNDGGEAETSEPAPESEGSTADCIEGQSTEEISLETEPTTTEIAEETVNGENDTPQADLEQVNLEQRVEEPENLTGEQTAEQPKNLAKEQKEELNTLTTKADIKVEDLPGWLRAMIYAGKNVFNFISKKGYVDKKVDEYLQKDLKGKDIYVALHGILQTYWSSFAGLVKYSEKEGMIVIPIKSNSTKEIYDSIFDLKEKTGAKIHLIAHSRGGRYALDAVVDHGLDQLVQEIILSGTPIHEQDGTLLRTEYAEVGKKVKLTNIYGLNDCILPLFGRANYGDLPNAHNIPANAGHLDLIHNKDIFEIYSQPNLYTLPIKPPLTLPSNFTYPFTTFFQDKKYTA